MFKHSFYIIILLIENTSVILSDRYVVNALAHVHFCLYKLSIPMNYDKLNVTLPSILCYVS